MTVSILIGFGTCVWCSWIWRAIDSRSRVEKIVNSALCSNRRKKQRLYHAATAEWVQQQKQVSTCQHSLCIEFDNFSVFKITHIYIGLLMQKFW